MYTFLLVLYVINIIVLITVILLQQGKGADMGAVFGGSSQTLFGSGGAGNFLTRLTMASGGLFIVLALALDYTSARRVTTTIFEDVPPAEAPMENAAPMDQAPAPGAAPQAGAAGGEAPKAPAPAPQAPAPAPEAAAPQAAAPAAQAPAAPAPAEQPAAQQ